MTTRRLLRLSISIAATIATLGTYCIAQEPALGSSQLHEMNKSGVSARLYFFDDGNEVVVVGIASGLDQAQNYSTVLHGNGALPGGPSGCSGTTGLTVGSWHVNGDGVGSINASFFTRPGFGLEDYSASSIRSAPRMAPTGALQACGQIRLTGY